MVKHSTTPNFEYEKLFYKLRTRINIISDSISFLFIGDYLFIIMDERKEVETKMKVFNFIKDNLVLEGEKEKVSQKLRDLTSGIYDIFYPEKKS